LCTKIHCTTCGARDFRIGLLNQLQASTGIPAHGLFTAKAALALGEALAGIEAESSLEIEDAIRCILYDAWNVLPHTTFEQEFVPRLASSWSGYSYWCDWDCGHGKTVLLERHGDEWAVSKVCSQFVM
jgi:hypothetical protein